MISTSEYDLVIQPLHADHADRYRRVARGDPVGNSKSQHSGGNMYNPHIIIKRETGTDLRPGSGNRTDDEDIQRNTDERDNGNLNEYHEGEHFCGLDSSK